MIDIYHSSLGRALGCVHVFVQYPKSPYFINICISSSRESSVRIQKKSPKSTQVTSSSEIAPRENKKGYDKCKSNISQALSRIDFAILIYQSRESACLLSVQIYIAQQLQLAYAFRFSFPYNTQTALQGSGWVLKNMLQEAKTEIGYKYAQSFDKRPLWSN